MAQVEYYVDENGSFMETFVSAMLRKFKEDTGMSNAEWRIFCKRYAGRNISSVVSYLEDYYGDLPKNVGGYIQKELKSQVKAMEKELEMSSR